MLNECLSKHFPCHRVLVKPDISENTLTLAHSRQVDLQNTCTGGQVEILEKYQKYCNIFTQIINSEILV